MGHLLDEFLVQSVVDSQSGPEGMLRSHAREAYQMAEANAPTGPSRPPGDRTSGRYATPGRGVSGESVN